MQYKVLSITSAEIVIESKSGVKHIIEYGKGARPHIDLRKVRVGIPQVHIHVDHAFFLAEFEPRETNVCASFHVTSCAMNESYDVVLYCRLFPYFARTT